MEPRDTPPAAGMRDPARPNLPWVIAGSLSLGSAAVLLFVAVLPALQARVGGAQADPMPWMMVFVPALVGAVFLAGARHDGLPIHQEGEGGRTVLVRDWSLRWFGAAGAGGVTLSGVLSVLWEGWVPEAGDLVVLVLTTLFTAIFLTWDARLVIDLSRGRLTQFSSFAGRSGQGETFVLAEFHAVEIHPDPPGEPVRWAVVLAGPQPPLRPIWFRTRSHARAVAAQLAAAAGLRARDIAEQPVSNVEL